MKHELDTTEEHDWIVAAFDEDTRVRMKRRYKEVGAEAEAFTCLSEKIAERAQHAMSMVESNMFNLSVLAHSSVAPVVDGTNTMKGLHVCKGCAQRLILCLEDTAGLLKDLVEIAEKSVND